MKYQLVVQIRSNPRIDFDQLIELEDQLIELFGDQADVDGHDIGADEMNIFIYCEDPRRVFEMMCSCWSTLNAADGIAVAYRTLEQEAFEVLFPAELQSFSIA